MKANIRHILSAGIFLLALLSACSREEEWTDTPNSGSFLQIEGEIAGAGVAVSRANSLKPLTLSYASFEEGDRIGFFSYHGKDCTLGTHLSNGSDECKDYLRNELLTYSNILGSRRFTSATVENIALSKLGMTFAYYPYSSYQDGSNPDLSKGPAGYMKKNDKGSYEPLGDNDYYLNIFRSDGSFEDFLTAKKQQYFNINYKFEHQFAMLLLYLGEGFDPETEGNDKLTVHLTEKVIGAHVARKHNNGGTFDVTVDKVPKNEPGYDFGKSAFIAQKVEKYRLPDTSEEKTVYPIILPPGVEIDYIEVRDISGMKQKVKPTEKAFTDKDGNPTGLVSGMMYPLTIKMTGITPTIYPHDIIDWNVEKPIEVKELDGIYDTEDFEDWLRLYNQNIEKIKKGSGEISNEDYEVLESYGDWDSNTKKWTFYLRDSIDCSSIVAKDGRGALIKELPENVILDGRNNVLSNLMLDFEHNKPTDGMVGMIGKINGGTLINVRMGFVTVRNMDPSIPSGCIAAEMSSGTMKECIVRQAAVMSRDNRQAGVLAGCITGGTVYNCKFHGMIQADVVVNEDYPLYKGVVGIIEEEEEEEEGGLYLWKNIISRLIFTEEDQPENN